MQSTGHSSMHALSSTSTQVCAMMEGTGGLLSSFWSLLLSQYGGSVAGAASACDNTAARWILLGSVSLPAHIAIRRSPVITGIPHFADPVTLGVRDQPAAWTCPAATLPSPLWPERSVVILTRTAFPPSVPNVWVWPRSAPARFAFRFAVGAGAYQQDTPCGEEPVK